MKWLASKKWWIGGILLVALLLSSIVTNLVQLNTNQPNLGPGFEYIGSHRYRCFLWGLLCESDPYTDYYFATNMTEEQVKGYFRGARFTAQGKGWGENYTFNELGFRTLDGRSFGLDYYYGVKPSNLDSGLRPTKKVYGIDITDTNYAIAKSAL